MPRYCIFCLILLFQNTRTKLSLEISFCSYKIDILGINKYILDFLIDRNLN